MKILATISGTRKGDLVCWYKIILHLGDKRRNTYSNEPDNLDLEKYKRILLNKLNDILEFRSYQNNISESVINKNENTLVILPTALGKTVIAILVCAEFLYKYKSKRVLVMAPTKPLVAQHMSSFFSVLNIPEDRMAVVTGKDLPPS